MNVRGLKILVVALLVACACCWTLSIVSHASLTTAPLPWDEAYLMALPTRVAHAWSGGGPFEAIAAYFGTSSFKAPLSSLGTAVAMIAFGDGPLEIRLDNMIVAFVAAFAVQRFLARHAGELLASVFAACLLATPFALAYTRTELAEIYVVATTAVLYAYAVPQRALRTRSTSLALGALVGFGLCAKLSFVLISFPVLLWTFAHEALLLRSGSTTFRALLVRVLLGSLACILVVGAVCHRSLKPMWRHLRDQSTWVGDQYGGSASRFDLAYFEKYVCSLFASCSWLWLFVIGAISVLAIVDRTRGASRADPTSFLHVREARTDRSPVGQATMLAFAVLVNLAGCYFFPVTDVRFAIGAMIAAVLLLGLLAAWAVRRDALRDVLGFVMLVVFGSWLLANTYGSSSERTLLDLPWHFDDPGPMHPPIVDPDLRDPTLDAIGVGSRRVALAGDHSSFNIDNLRLRMLERGSSHELEQVGYLAPKIELAEALSRLDERRPVEFFLVCRPSPSSPSSLWTSQLGEPFFASLAASEDWTERQRIGALRDGSEVVLFERHPKRRK